MTTTDNASWKGDVWIHDNWTAEDKAKALDLLGSSTRRVNKYQDDQDEDQQQRNIVFNEFRRNASTNWNSFYEQNQTNFFKDRHYLHKAFPNEFAWLYAHSSDHDDDDELDEFGNPRLYSIPKRIKNEEFIIVEIGCGVGNAILPLLEQHTELVHKHASLDDDDAPPPRLNIHCLDFAPTAIHLLKQDSRFCAAAEEGRATAHVYDISSMHPSTISTSPSSTTNNDKQSTTLANSADVAILLFCLSAIGPHPSPALSRAARHAMDMLKPGGTLVIRDYGRLDEAQMKLSKGEKSLGSNFYRKGDGTGCYYFELQDLKDLFVNDDDEDDCTKLELLELDYIQRIYRNRGENSTRRRVWIQGRFRKPFDAAKESKHDVTSSIGCIDSYSSTLCKRWDNYYRTQATMKTSSLPSNLFQIFPNEFSPWQSLMKHQKKGKPQNVQSLMKPSYSVPDNIVTIVDLGCGLGNTSLLNLIQSLHQQPPGEEVRPKVNAHFLYVSSEAIRQLCDDERYQSGIASGSVESQVYDVRQPVPVHLEGSVDIVLLLYAMSAIGPYNCEDLSSAVSNIMKMLKPGGVILFRDYGRYDDDQLQLNSVSGAQISNNFYLRDVNGNDEESKDRNTSELCTGCYFFELDEVKEMFADLEELQLECSTRIYKKTGKSAKDLNKNGGAAERRRVWIQGRFRKPF